MEEARIADRTNRVAQSQSQIQAKRREKYVYLHMLEGMPERLGEFETFYYRRRKAIQERIVQLLGAGSSGMETPARSSPA